MTSEFLFQGVNLSGQFLVKPKCFAQAHEGAHDGNVDPDGLFAPQTLDSMATPGSVKA